MADDKKKSDKEAGPVTNDKLYQHLGEILGIIFLVFFLSALFNRFQLAIAQRGYISDSPQLNALLSSIFYTMAAFILFFTIFSNILSILFLMGIIYSVIRLTEINVEEAAKLQIYDESPAQETEGNKDWKRIQELINSENESEWKLAIIESDILLGEVLERMGLPGETIGDKLKAVEKSDFTTIEYAWEAHKVRNAIAHEGGDYLINKREADRVIALYEAVFREFEVI